MGCIRPEVGRSSNDRLHDCGRSQQCWCRCRAYEAQSRRSEQGRIFKAAALQSGFVTAAEFDRVVDPRKMVAPVAGVG
jgi:hypothetical protein